MMFKTLDVAIGISFLYLLTTFVASVIVEFISNWRNWRGEMLYAGIGNMLSNSTMVTAAEVCADPLIAGLARNDAAPSRLDFLEKRGWRPVINNKRITFPSYIPAASFSSAVLDVLILKANPEKPPPTCPDEMVATIASALMAARADPKFPKDTLRAVIETTLAARGDKIQALQFALEKWFNDSMDRVSGWYKRRTQSILLMIGLLIAFGGNINTIAVTLWLWDGDAARQAVVAAAADYSKNHALPAAVTGDESGRKALGDSFVSMTKQIADIDRNITAMQFPLGWPREASLVWLWQYLVGGLLTAIAISMGSTFWFDTLQSLFNIRGSGPKPNSR